MKAIALISGGLDSTLALRLIKEQGIELLALNFKTPFCLCDRKTSSGCGNLAKEAANNLNIELRIVNVSEDFFKVIKNPKHGYGSNMNPCIDCRILMLRKAQDFMLEVGASFLITGEVVGQRPMSQQRNTLRLIEKESGLEGLILRPLSAKLLPETIPEKEGWVDRGRLLDFNGRSRKPQIALAEELGIKDYPCAAGGCLLTDPMFSLRLKDLLQYSSLNLNEVELLKVGRHFRLSPVAKLIVGRDENENGRLLNLGKKDDFYFEPHEIKGPVALGRGNLDSSLIELSCQILSRYCDLDGKSHVDIEIKNPKHQEAEKVMVQPLFDEALEPLRI